MFQGWLRVSWRWRTFRTTKLQQNDKKCWQNLTTHPRRPSPNNPWTRRHRCDQLWSLPGDLNRNFEHAPHCSFITTNAPAHTSLKTTEFVTNNNMVIIPHPPYSPDLAPLCFPNWKCNRRDDVLKQYLTSEGNRECYSTALRKITSTVLLKHGKNDGIAVYVPKETILKEMAVKIE
jgi:hypothetical protein